MPVDPDLVILEGWEKYGRPIVGESRAAAAAIMNNGIWSGFYATSLSDCRLLPARVGTGAMLETRDSSAGGPYMNFPTTYGRCIGGCHMEVQLLSGYAAVVAFSNLDAGNANNWTVGVYIDRSTGEIQLRRGFYNATILETAPNLLVDDSVYCIEWDICPKSSGGYAKVWVDKVLVIDYTGDTAGEPANGITGIIVAPYFCPVDHNYFWLYTSDVDNGEEPALTQPLIYTDFPDALDGTPDSVPTQGILGYGDRTGNTVSSNDDTIYLMEAVANVSGTLDEIGWRQSATNATAKWKICIYSDASGSPDSLLGSSVEQTGFLPSQWMFAALQTPVAIVEGTSYWIGVHHNANTTADRGPADIMGMADGQTYESGLTDPAVAAPQTNSHSIVGKLSGIGATDHVKFMGCTQIDENAQPYTVLDAAAEQDLFTFPTFPVAPTTIYGVQMSALMQKTEAGAVTADLDILSDATTGNGDNPAQAISSGGFAWMLSFFKNDPDGDVAWVKAQLDAAKYGYSVDSLV